VPAKFAPSARITVRGEVKKSHKFQHHYMKGQSVDTLVKYIADGQKPKLKQKCRNELVRRGINF